MAYDSVTHGNAGLLSALSRTFADLRDRFGRAVENRHAYNEILAQLKQLDDRDLTDLGISRADFHDIAAGRYRLSQDR